MNKFCYLIAACLSLSAVSTQAATIEYSGTDVISVTGLIVDNGIYDAIFYDGSYNSLLADYPAPAYQTDYTAAFAEAATQSLFQFAITDSGFTGVAVNDISGCYLTSACLLGTVVGQNSLYAWSFTYTGNGTSSTDPQYYDGIFAGPDTNYTSVSYVVWNQTGVVPVPAAVWLFSSGLLGLIGAARRKRAAA